MLRRDRGATVDDVPVGPPPTNPRPPVGVRPGTRRTTVGWRSTVLLVTAALLTVLAGASSWMGRDLASSDGFAQMAGHLLRSPAVRAGIADQVVSALEEQPIGSLPAVVAHPLFEKVVQEVVASQAFEDIFVKGVRELHAGLMGGRTQLLVDVDDAGPLVREALRLLNPVLADAVSDAQIELIVGVTQNASFDRVLRLSQVASRVALPLGALAAATFVLAVVVSRDRRRTTQWVGATFVMAGVGTLALLAAGLALVQELGAHEREKQTLAALFGTLTQIPETMGRAAVLGGTVVLVAASLAGRRPKRSQVATMRAFAVRLVERRDLRLLGCLAAGGLALTALTRPIALSSVALRVTGVALLVVVTTLLLELVGAAQWPTAGSGRRVLLRQALTFACALALVNGVLLVGGRSVVHAAQQVHPSDASIQETGCNGHIELCDRRLDQVVFAGTHNSMAAAGAAGRWWFARQTLGVEPQLRAGIRAFLFDLHLGREEGGVVRSDFRTELERQQAVEDVPPEERAVMDRLLAMLGLAPEGNDVYMCHGYCEFGAVRAVDELAIIERFLETNPNEVVLLLLEDHLPPDRAVAALEASGIGDRAYTWAPGTPLPTLRSMIESGRNVLVMVEHEAGGASWYQPMFDRLLQDTDYRFESADAMTCAPNRGTASNPLLLVNHWLEKEHIVPADAASVNTRQVLLSRATECEAERHRLPNVIAVDFYSHGDLLAVVDELNGVRS